MAEESKETIVQAQPVKEPMSVGMKVALLIMLLVFLYMFCVTFFEMPATGIEHSKTIVGFLMGTALTTFINYYWGNSSKKEQGDTTK